MNKQRIVSIVGAAVLLGSAVLFGREPQQAALDIRPVAGTVSYLVSGRGGNIGVSVGDDGVLVIDDLFADTVPQVEEALKKLSEEQPVFLVNTHWHGDHTGGNAHFGRQATIVAHRNVRRRLDGDGTIGGNVDQDTPAAALPVITYDESAAIHFNGEEIRLIHVPGAHTDGDTVVWFTGSNVVHMGDLYFQIGYPFIDTNSGGDVEGLIAGLERILAEIPADAKIIPGHGDLTRVFELSNYLTMIETITERVRELLPEGFSIDEMLEAGVTEEFDERWGGAFIDPRRFVESIVTSLR